MDVPKQELLLLNELLKTAGSYQQILDFCKSDRPVCQRNKQLLSKKVLELSGYTVFPRNPNYVELYRDLVVHCKNKTGYIRVTDVRDQCFGHLSDDILDLFRLNGITVHPTPMSCLVLGTHKGAGSCTTTTPAHPGPPIPSVFSPLSPKGLRSPPRRNAVAYSFAPSVHSTRGFTDTELL